MTWPTWYPTDNRNAPTKFKAAYDVLVKAGVKFPSEINYFKKKPDIPPKPQNPKTPKPQNPKTPIQIHK